MNTRKIVSTIAGGLLMTLVALPCFAEIRIDRGGYTSGGIICNAAYFWNDKYDNLSPGIAKAEAMRVGPILQQVVKNGTSTTHIYLYHGTSYRVAFVQLVGVYGNDYQIAVACQYENGYSETLYNNNNFLDYNTAKAKFDSLCQQYYNKIAK